MVGAGLLLPLLPELEFCNQAVCYVTITMSSSHGRLCMADYNMGVQQ